MQKYKRGIIHNQRNVLESMQHRKNILGNIHNVKNILKNDVNFFRKLLKFVVILREAVVVPKVADFKARVESALFSILLMILELDSSYMYLLVSYL